MYRSVAFLISLLTPIALLAQTVPTTRPTLCRAARSWGDSMLIGALHENSWVAVRSL